MIAELPKHHKKFNYAKNIVIMRLESLPIVATVTEMKGPPKPLILR